MKRESTSLYRELLAEHGLLGSMGRRGYPYDLNDNAKVEAVCPMAYETFEEVAANLPRFSTMSTTAGGCTRPRLPELCRV